MTLPFLPLVILGAARSGTNMLRDALCRLPGFATWPCDEINPVWRHGNLGWPDDAIPPARAARAAPYIRGRFARLARRSGAAVVVEKTCANTLRVPFVAAVLPEARFVHLVRDGRDVVPSAMRRWRGELEMPGLAYRLAKARQAPLLDLPAYGLAFLRSRVARGRGRLGLWGPRFPGLAAMLEAGSPLEEVCAAQWAASVEAAEAALAALPQERWIRLRYEDVTADPRAALRAVLALCGREAPEAAIAAAADGIRAGRRNTGPQAEPGASACASPSANLSTRATPDPRPGAGTQPDPGAMARALARLGYGGHA